MNFLSSIPRHRIFSQPLMIGAICAASLLTGIAPNVSIQLGQSLALEFGLAAQAQAFSDEDIAKYANAVLALEPKRQAAYDEISNRTGSVPQVVCNETRRINNLSGNVRAIAVNYCEEAKKIIEGQGLTVSQFNDITRQQKQDASLRQRIQNELIRIQQESAGSP